MKWVVRGGSRCANLISSVDVDGAKGVISQGDLKGGSFTADLIIEEFDSLENEIIENKNRRLH